MPALIINVYVSPRAAILAGKTVVGNQTISIVDEDLKKVPEDLRLELALAYEAKDHIGQDPGEPPVIEPSLVAILPALTHRAAARKVAVEAQRKVDARAAEEALVASRENTAKDNARSKALRVWVEKHGDDEQKARMLEGFLPEDEILDEISEELLDIPMLSKYDALRRGDACECACAGRVQFEIGPPRYLDAFQFAKLTTARENAPEGSTVTAVEHKASCPSCKCVPIARIEARVTLPWNGWLLVRSYLLG